jgi:hypothetical protein
MVLGQERHYVLFREKIDGGLYCGETGGRICGVKQSYGESCHSHSFGEFRLGVFTAIMALGGGRVQLAIKLT